MGQEQNKTIVQRFIERTLYEGDVDAARAFVANDVVEQIPFPGQGPGLDGLKGVLRALRVAFADMRWAVEEQIADGDKTSGDVCRSPLLSAGRRRVRSTCFAAATSWRLASAGCSTPASG